MKKYILTLELRYTVHKEEDSDYKTRKFTIGEFADFDQAVKEGNRLIEGLNLDHPATPGINGDRLGTPIFGTVKNNLIRNYLRNDKGTPLGEMFIKISTVQCVDVETALQICNKFKPYERVTEDPLK